MLIRVAPEDQKIEMVPLVERVRQDAPEGGKGLGVSFALHAVALAVLSSIMIHRPGADGDLLLDLGWSVPGRKVPESVPDRVPLRLESLTKLPKQTAAPKPKDTPPKKSPGPNVRPVGVGGMLSGRGSGQRAGMLQEHGGDKKSERAVAQGLAWLARHQLSGGNWKLETGYPDAGYRNLRTDTGATALALLAFLGSGSTHADGPHQEVVARGIRWLVGIQKNNGDFHDHIEEGRQTAYYAHAQATIVLCEALALTGDRTLREPAERAVKFLLDSQHPTNGGWRYRPQTVETSGDLSVTGWVLMALNTARMAEIDVPDEAFFRTSEFIDSVQEDAGARYKYEPADPASRVTVAMTAEGLLCRQWLGWEKDGIAMHSGVAFAMRPQHMPEWSEGRRNVYAWYYTAQMLHNIGGGNWNRWFAQAIEAITENQVRVGNTREPSKDVRGSWHPTDPVGANEEYGRQGGRLYITCMCLLILETPYRHAAIYAEPEEVSEAGP